jgi:hypothetical protein
MKANSPMSNNPFQPTRVNPGDEQWEALSKSWYVDGKPRTFAYQGVIWMQIVDNEGICFVPTRPANGIDGIYDSSSFKGMR